LYRRHVDHIYRYLLMRTGNVDDAQDLTAQTFIAALESIASYEPRAPFRLWLLGIARHKLGDFFRKARRTLPLDAAESVPHPDPLPDEIVGQNIQVERVVGLLRGLSPDRSEAFLLRVFGEMSAAETQWIVLEFDRPYTLDGAIVQADNNDAYLLSYRDPDTGNWLGLWTVPPAYSFGMATRPDPSDDTRRQVLPKIVTADAVRLEAEFGDGMYAVGEIQLFGVAAGP
jgi:RNA polymerase sigma factor (sigma-70 family)